MLFTLTSLGDVYREATLVVGATSTTSSEGGFLGRRQNDAHYFSTTPSSKHHDACCTAWIPHHDNDDEVSNHQEGPLNGRAWAFQERLLARRFLSFGSQELSWECGESFRCECGGASKYLHAYQTYHLTNPDFNKDTVGDMWYWTVPRGYGGRALTIPEDKLPAMSGVAKLYQSVLDDQYLAGLWAKDLILGLSWKVDTDPVYRHHILEPHAYVAPSWSWLSVDANVGYLGPRLLHNDTEVVSAYCTPSGNDPTGRICAGAVTLRGPFQEAWMRLSPYKLKTCSNVRLYLSKDLSLDNVFGLVDTDTPLAVAEETDATSEPQFTARRMNERDYDRLRAATLAEFGNEPSDSKFRVSESTGSSTGRINFQRTPSNGPSDKVDHADQTGTAVPKSTNCDGQGDKGTNRKVPARVYCLLLAHGGNKTSDDDDVVSHILVLSRASGTSDEFTRIGVIWGSKFNGQDQLPNAETKTITII